MKKFLLPLLAILFFTACKKEIVTDKVSEEIAGVAASRTSSKINMFHYSAVTDTRKTININVMDKFIEPLADTQRQFQQLCPALKATQLLNNPLSLIIHYCVT